MSTSWNDLIYNTKVKELIKQKNRPLVTLHSWTSLRGALETLRENNILSVPVLDETERLVGLVDVLDIAGYVLHSWKYDAIHLDSDSYKERNYSRHKFFDTQLNRVVDYSGVDKVVTVGENSSIGELLDIFCSKSKQAPIHRVVVLDSYGKLANIVSQSDIIAFANIFADKLPLKVTSRRVKDFGTAHPVLMVRVDTPFYATLEVLVRNRIGGIAITDENGRITGNISASDLRGINENSFGFFNKSTIQFLVKGTSGGLLPPVVCMEDAPLVEVIKLLATQRIHRVYVNSSIGNQQSFFPSGIITLTDIMRLLWYKESSM